MGGGEEEEKTHPEQPHLGCTDAILRGEELGGEKEHTRRVVLSTRRPGSVTDTDKQEQEPNGAKRKNTLLFLHNNGGC